MAGLFQAPKGVPEYYPPESEAFTAVRRGLARPAELAGYGYIELPVFEDTNLFVRGMGESTDVVSKEMYTFEDRGGRSLTLRPEGTAGVMRSVIEHGMDRAALPVKLWYYGQFFRAERPQHGRYRQLQQVGVEAIGVDDPALDAEVVAMADAAFRGIGLRDYVLMLTSLGCSGCRPAYRATLVEFLDGLDLDDATKERARLNPLRVLDDKRSAVQAQLVSAPVQVQHLCPECSVHYDRVREYLSSLGVAWQEAPRLVRGLDYYTRTTFEFQHAGLGAQSGIGGGGRYDGLMAELGGQPLSGIGYGLGVDRAYLACQTEAVAIGAKSRCDVFLVPVGEAAKDRLVALAGQLRSAGIRTDLAYGDRGLKGAMKLADRSKARFALVLGDRDIADGTIGLKHMASGEQHQVALAGIVDTVKEKLT